MKSISIFKRLSTAYLTIGKTFGTWVSPIITGILISTLRIIVFLGMTVDTILFSRIRNRKVNNPIIIVGNPRSGTTFLHRYLVNNGIGVGSQLWQLIYPSVILQKCIRPILPLLEKISPTRHHSTVAHKTSLSSVETDDASMLFRFFDGFFLYGFIMSWAEKDVFDWFDPKLRDTSKRDFDWLESIWKRTLFKHKDKRIVGKLFSISTNVPKFLDRFNDAHLLYMVRDPLSVIPSGLSLVTGVLDKRFGFWSLSPELQQRYIKRLYKALVELLVRFHDDWTHDKIDKKRVMIVRYDRMMADFDGLMTDVMNFVGHEPSQSLMDKIQETAEAQRNYSSKHKYDLSKFGLTEEQIQEDCKCVYDTFLTEEF